MVYKYLILLYLLVPGDYWFNIIIAIIWYIIDYISNTWKYYIISFYIYKLEIGYIPEYLGILAPKD